MGSLGMPEILTILVIALIIFGPRKLPELGKTLGKSLAQFRKASEDFKRQWEDEVELEKRRLDAPPPPIEGPDEVEAAAKSETDSSQAGYLPYGEGINAGEPEQPAVISDSVISDTEISNTEVSNTEVSDTAQEPVTVARGSDAVKETKRDWM